MIIEKIEELCIKNRTTITALCKEITGSSGNLPTWKKDNIRPEWLRAICLKFNISSDYLLDLPSTDSAFSSLTREEGEALNRFNRLCSDYRIKAQSFMVDLYEKQQSQQSLLEQIEGWENDFDESVAAEERYLDDQGKSSPSSGTGGDTKVG